MVAEFNTTKFEIRYMDQFGKWTNFYFLDKNLINLKAFGVYYFVEINIEDYFNQDENLIKYYNNFAQKNLIKLIDYF